MLKLPLARQLKAAGLRWQPRMRDFFAIPDRGLDDDVFVLANMAIQVEKLGGHPAIMFQGAYEWALDYIFLQDVVWLPRESQLRAALLPHLDQAQALPLRLNCTNGGYVCEIQFQDGYHTFEGAEAETAYANALLYILRHEASQ